VSQSRTLEPDLRNRDLLCDWPRHNMKIVVMILLIEIGLSSRTKSRNPCKRLPKDYKCSRSNKLRSVCQLRQCSRSILRCRWNKKAGKSEWVGPSIHKRCRKDDDQFHLQQRWNCLGGNGAAAQQEVKAIAYMSTKKQLYLIVGHSFGFSVWEVSKRMKMALMQEVKLAEGGLERLEIINPNNIFTLFAAGRNMSTQVYQFKRSTGFVFDRVIDSHRLTTRNTASYSAGNGLGLYRCEARVDKKGRAHFTLDRKRGDRFKHTFSSSKIKTHLSRRSRSRHHAAKCDIIGGKDRLNLFFTTNDQSATTIHISAMSRRDKKVKLIQNLTQKSIISSSKAIFWRKRSIFVAGDDNGECSMYVSRHL